MPDWRKAHVVGHVARNAEALTRLATWARTGVETTMYADRAQRATEIEESATLPPQELGTSLVDTTERLDRELGRLNDGGWLWGDHPPLSVVHYPQEYRDLPYARPRGVYENDEIRVEWQILDGRQPFYHRNCDVDEISYQIAGERALMTELGVLDHRRGDFSRIPRGVAHDNYCVADSHLLFYIPARAELPAGSTVVVTAATGTMGTATQGVERRRNTRSTWASLGSGQRGRLLRRPLAEQGGNVDELTLGPVRARPPGGLGVERLRTRAGRTRRY